MKKLCVCVFMLSVLLVGVFLLNEDKSKSPKLLPLNSGTGEYKYTVEDQGGAQFSVSGGGEFPVTVVVQSPDASRVEFTLEADKVAVKR